MTEIQEPPEALRFSATDLKLVELADSEGSDSLSPTPVKFRMLAHSGKPMNGFGSFDVVDLDSLKVAAQKKPILLQHDHERPVGFTTQIEFTNKGLEVEGQFLQENEEATRIIENLKQGFPWEASISISGFNFEHIPDGAKARVNGKNLTGPGFVLRNSEFREVSFVAVGADSNTKVKMLSSLEQYRSQQHKQMELEVSSEKGQPMTTPAVAEVTVASLSVDHPEVANELRAEGRLAARDEFLKVLSAASPEQYDLVVKCFEADEFDLSASLVELCKDQRAQLAQQKEDGRKQDRLETKRNEKSLGSSEADLTSLKSKFENLSEAEKGEHWGSFDLWAEAQKGGE